MTARIRCAVCRSTLRPATVYRYFSASDIAGDRTSRRLDWRASERAGRRFPPTHFQDRQTLPPSKIVHLFREEAQQHAQNGSIGSLVLDSQFTLTLVAYASAVIFSVAMYFVLTADVARKTQISGAVVPVNGAVGVRSLLDGTVVGVQVGEGQRVKAGQVLFEVSTQRGDRSNAAREGRIEGLLTSRKQSLAEQARLQSQQDANDMLALAHRISSLDVEIDRLGQQVQLQQERIKLAESDLSRNTQLEKAGFMSGAKTRALTADLLDQKLKGEDLAHQQASARIDRDDVQSRLAALRNKAQQDARSAERDTTEIDQAMIEREENKLVQVVAARDGVLSGVTVEVGQPVIANQVLATLLPADGVLGVTLYAPPDAIGNVKVGMPVKIRYHAFPYQKYGQFPGVVQEISQVALRQEDLPCFESGATRGRDFPYKFRIRVALKGQTVRVGNADEALKPGTTVDATVMGETRKVYQLIFPVETFLTSGT